MVGIIRPYRQKILLDVAEERHVVNVSGEYFAFRRGSDDTAEVRVWLEEISGDDLPFSRFEDMAGFPFSRLILQWDAQPGAWLDLVIMTGDRKVS